VNINATTRPGLRWLAGGLATGLVIAALMAPAATVAQNQSDSDTVRSINVSGVGRVKAEPDVADIQIGVSKQGEDAQAAAEKAAESMDAVITSLLDSGIAETDIQTTNLNLNPVYNYNTDPAKIVGWQANNNVSVTIRDIEVVGDVIDAATVAGANEISGISFRVDDPSAAEALARSAAVADAAAKAEQLASDAGVTIVGVITISESGGQQPQPIFMAREEASFAAADSSFSTPVLAGQVELSVFVNIQYEIE
jgi:hypothetical protein